MFSFFATGKTKIGQFEIFNKSGHLKIIVACTFVLAAHLILMHYFDSKTAVMLANLGSSEFEKMNGSILAIMPPFMTYLGAILIILLTTLIHIKVDYQRTILSQNLGQSINEFEITKSKPQLKSMFFMTAMVRFCNHLGLINFSDSKNLAQSSQEEIELFKQQRDKLFEKIKSNPDLSNKTLIEFLNLELTPDQIENLKQI